MRVKIGTRTRSIMGINASAMIPKNPTTGICAILILAIDNVNYGLKHKTEIKPCGAIHF